MAFFLAASLVVTHPLACAPDRAPSLHADYFQNLWNAWWLPTALAGGESPYFTRQLFFPQGVSLARHTLSPLHAGLAALLAPVLGPHDAYKALLLAHFVLAGWITSLLARELTGDWRASLLAGLLFALAPYHLYYLAQINLAATGLLPLLLLALLRLVRDGGIAAVAAAALAAALLAAADGYYLVYGALLGLFVAAAGRSLAPATPTRVALARLALAAAACAPVVALLAAPTLAAALGPEAGDGAFLDDAAHVTRRSNDLLGFLWVAPPERALVGWPTMLGFGGLALVAAGARGVRAQPAWIALALGAWLLSLGPELRVGGAATGLPLPYAALLEVPALDLLRKPDRFFVLAQLAFALLAAFAWRDLARRSPRAALLWPAAAVLLVAEFSGPPLRTFALEPPAWLERVARSDARAVVELPPHGGSDLDARALWHQTLHGKPMPEGYVTNLALTRSHLEETRTWLRAWQRAEAGDAGPLAAVMASRGVDLALLPRRELVVRPASDLEGAWVLAPFCAARARLMEPRQLGLAEERPLPPERLAALRAALAGALEPVSLDAELAIFRRAD